MMGSKCEPGTNKCGAKSFLLIKLFEINQICISIRCFFKELYQDSAANFLN